MVVYVASDTALLAMDLFGRRDTRPDRIDLILVYPFYPHPFSHQHSLSPDLRHQQKIAERPSHDGSRSFWSFLRTTYNSSRIHWLNRPFDVNPLTGQHYFAVGLPY